MTPEEEEVVETNVLVKPHKSKEMTGQ